MPGNGDSNGTLGGILNAPGQVGERSLVRDDAMTRWIEVAGQDFRYAIRGLRKSPGFTVVAVLTLSIAIGATTAVFSVINGILLRPLPYPDQDRLVALSNVYPKNPQRTGPVSGTDVAHWRGNQVFEHLEFVSDRKSVV